MGSDIANDLQIPEELRGSLPRAIRRRAGGRRFPLIGKIAISLFFVPFIFVGACFLPVALEPLLVLCVPTRPALLTRMETRADDDAGTTYFVRYQYRLGGIDRAGSDAISKEEYDSGQFHVEQSLRVQAVSAGMIDYALIVRPIGAYVAIRYPIWIFGGFWNLFIWSIICGFIIGALRRRRLLRYGHPVVGCVLWSKIYPEDSDGDPTYHIQYEYTPSNGVKRTAKMMVRNNRYSPHDNRKSVIVLYNPRRPRISTIYNYLNFEAVPPTR